MINHLPDFLADHYTGLTGTGVSEEAVADARRGRLIRRLLKLLREGDYLSGPLGRLRWRGMLLVLCMLAAHAVCYGIVHSLIGSQERWVGPWVAVPPGWEGGWSVQDMGVELRG